MSEGTAAAYVCRYYINDAGTGILQLETDLTGVKMTYRPHNLEDYQGTNGRLEAIYWGPRGNTDVDVRAFKGGNNIKYREEIDRELVILVAGKDRDDSGQDIEQRSAELLGGIIKGLQANQPPSPGSHLLNVTAYVSSWGSRIGTLSRGATKVHVISHSVIVHIQANVEQ